METCGAIVKELSTYLNDHLAGSVGAVDMLEDMISAHEDESIAAFLQELLNDVNADQRQLKELIDQLGIEESKMRKAAAWAAEKFSRAKLRIGDSGVPNLALLQSLEALTLGITGKRSLWRTLGAAAKEAPPLRGFGFARLEERAKDQFERVEAQAINVACKIFPRELAGGESDR